MAFEACVGTNNKVDRFFEIDFQEEANSAVTNPEMMLRLKYCVASLVPGSPMSGFFISPVFSIHTCHRLLVRLASPRKYDDHSPVFVLPAFNFLYL